MQIVLVHGGWVGGWVWDGVADELRRMGHEVIAPTLRGEIVWCQGYSEPGAGSDLAALRTSAREENGEFVINGQKIWTTLAQYADWIFCLVRTDPEAKKQEGISFLLIDLRSPGVEVRPIWSIDEVLTLNDELRELIVQRASIRQIKEAARANGPKFLRDSAMSSGRGMRVPIIDRLIGKRFSTSARI